MPKSPLESSRTEELHEIPHLSPNKKASTDVVKDIRNFAQETPQPPDQEAVKRRNNSFPYTHMNEDGHIVTTWIEVKSPRQSDQTSKETGKAKDVRNAQLSPREMSYDTLTPDQQRIYDRFPPELQRDSALEEVLFLASKRIETKREIIRTDSLIKNYKFVREEMNKEIDSFKEEYIAAFGVQGDKLSKFQNEVVKGKRNIKESYKSLTGKKGTRISEGYKEMSLLEALKHAEETGSVGYEKAEQSKDMFTKAPGDIYQKYAAAKEAEEAYHSQLSRQKRHLHDSQRAYEKAKKALPDQQRRKAFSEAEDRIIEDVKQEEKVLDNRRNITLNNNLDTVKKALRDDIAAAKKVLSEAIEEF